jgi:hypothetical protein
MGVCMDFGPLWSATSAAMIRTSTPLSAEDSRVTPWSPAQ